MDPLRLLLRDIKTDLVEAWEEAFGAVPEVEISEGDIFQRTADAIVSPANSFGFMDGGIDLAYSRHFGWELQARLQVRIRKDFGGELPVGVAAIVETDHPDIPFMVSAPTMRVPMVVDETVNAYLAFRAALLAVQAHNATGGAKIASILCPGMGTAVGRMRSETCARQMRAAYDTVLGGLDAFPSRLGEARDLHFALIR